MTYRPIPFYFLTTRRPEDYTMERVRSAMSEVKAAGFGGIVFFNKPPDGFDAESYLSDFYFDVLERFILAAREEGLELWVNDGFDFPPGDAAGRIAKENPSLKQLRLRPTADGSLETVEVPWGFPAFEEPDSSRLFIKHVYEEHARRLGRYFGDGVTGIFSDADNRRVSFATSAALNGERYYPWSASFPQRFRERFGYDVQPRLKGLFDGTDRALCRDYWRLCGELYQQWFRNNAAWCQAHGLDYTFHTSDTGPLNWGRCYRSSAFSEGDGLELLACSLNPGTDHELLQLDSGRHYDSRLFSPKVTRGGGTEALYNDDWCDTSHDIRAKLAQSAAFLNGRSRSMCEMFAATNWGVTFAQLRCIAAWQIMQGINFIVPHAVHYLFHGETKYFAPPEFLHSTLRHGVRSFNDWLAPRCEAAAAGTLVAEVAVLDATEDAWQGRDTEGFFALCDRLNRYPGGYIVVPAGWQGDSPAVVIDYRNPPEELPSVDIAFDGGQVAIMRRRLEDGTEYLLVSNVWEEKTLCGTLVFHGRKVPLELAQGEIAIVGGPCEDYRSPSDARTVPLPEQAAVAWGAPNAIPFETSLEFALAEEIDALVLYVPAGVKAALDGTPLDDGESCFRQGDAYRCWRLALAPGKHCVAAVASFDTPCVLEGEFDVDYRSTGDWARKVKTTYMLEIYEPQNESVCLSRRRGILRLDCGWERQGQLFYSGTADYDLGSMDVRPGDVLRLPEVGGTAELLVDGAGCGVRVAPPFEWKLPSGRHRIVVRCANTMGNFMERYAAPSGLLPLAPGN